jgi:ribosomal protein L13E
LKQVSVFAEVTREGRGFAFAEATANGVSNPEVSGTIKLMHLSIRKEAGTAWIA